LSARAMVSRQFIFGENTNHFSNKAGIQIKRSR
jgi:hypothetical protein